MPLGLGHLQNIVNVHWEEKGAGILVFAFYDIEYASKPEVTIEGGEGYIAGAFQPKQEGGFTVSCYIAVNLTKFDIGKTKVSVECSGSGPTGQTYESEGFTNVVPVRIEPGYLDTGRAVSGPYIREGLAYYRAGGEGPRHMDPPTHYEVFLGIIDPITGVDHRTWQPVPWAGPISGSQMMSSNFVSINIYNGWLEHFGAADSESGKVHEPQENYEPLWPTKDTKPGSTLEIPWDAFGGFYVHSANPACALEIPLPTTGDDGIERKSLYRVRTHFQPLVTPTIEERTAANWVDASCSYTLDNKWDKDDRYDGAIYDGWKTEDAEPTKIKDSQRVDCNDTGED